MPVETILRPVLDFFGELLFEAVPALLTKL
jgi:hypothetical protein